MATTVEIDIELLSSALTAMEDLASAIDTQRTNATSGTPIALPSLSDANLGSVAVWLRENTAELETRRDLARLLDVDGTGQASFEVDVNSLASIERLFGEQLAQTLLDLDHFSEDELEHINEILEDQKDNPAVMAHLFESLGPDGTAGVLGQIDSGLYLQGSEELVDLAENLRDGLATASESDRFLRSTGPPHGRTYGEEFSRELVRHLVVPLLSTEEQDAFRERFPDATGSGASILSFLFEGPAYADGFLFGAAEQLDEFERLAQDGPLTAESWYSHNGNSPLPTANSPSDPMSSIMGALGDNPEVGLRFFTSHEERPEYYFRERDWLFDEFEGVSRAVAAITTDQGLWDTRPEDTGLLASQFVNYIADNDRFDPSNAEAASPHIAEMLSHFTPAVDHTIRNGNADGPPRTHPYEQTYIGTMDHYPQFYTGDLESVMAVALTTADGAEHIANGIGTFQQMELNNISATLAADPDNDQVQGHLRDAIQRHGALRGYAEHIVGEVEISEAQGRDEQRQAFINLINDAAGQVPLPGANAVGQIGSRALNAGWNYVRRTGSETAGDYFASETAEAIDDATIRAEAGSRDIKINTFLALAEAGIIPEEDISDIWFDDRGQLIAISAIDTDDMPAYSQQAMNQVSGYASHADLETAYKNEFIDYYQE